MEACTLHLLWLATLLLSIPHPFLVMTQSLLGALMANPYDHLFSCLCHCVSWNDVFCLWNLLMKKKKRRTKSNDVYGAFCLDFLIFYDEKSGVYENNDLSYVSPFIYFN
jgi:hypothetical protein